ncbi:hypothetical protein BC830DRAFT_1173203 [Chytriomyces sp. MP71]|nr:hypothetical protein BC830DRAFT_1173203 [Chytriomyces sp. MP71]
MTELETTEAATSGACVFVRGIPYEATSAQLEAFFGEVGPIKTCFVVGDKDKIAANKGYGFVTFALKEDASRALTDLKEARFLGQRKLLMELAVRRSADPKDKPVKKEKKAGAPPPTTKKNPHPSTLPVKKRASTMVELSKLPEGLEQKQLNHKVRKMGTIKELVYPVMNGDEVAKGLAHVIYETPTDALHAVSKLNNHVFKGVTIFAKLTEGAAIKDTAPLETSDATNRGKPRLIVRNLPFTCTETHVRVAFAPLGTVKYVNFPTRPDKAGNPLSRGFAFVQMKDLKECEAALEKLNGSKIAGRVVAVDWAMPKEWYNENGEGKADSTASVDEMTAEEGGKVKDELEDVVDEESGGDVDGEADEVDGENDEGVDVQDVEGEEEEEDHEVGDEPMDEDDNNVEITLDEETLNDVEDDAEKEDQFETIQDGDTDDVDVAPAKPKMAANVEEGCTLFVRNLLFETTEEELRNRFLAFGKLRYARITKDPTTGRSRGTGFICFFNKADADECMIAYEAAAKSHALLDDALEKPAEDLRGKKHKKDAKASQSKSMLVPEPSLTSAVTAPFILGERFLNLSVAVSKQESAKLTTEGVRDRRANDRRHMYLIKEGVIFQNSRESEGILPTELSKRQKSYTERKRLLASNPNLFLSRTRLSVRNLGLKVTEFSLKRAAILCVKRFWEEAKQRKRKGLEDEVLEEDKQDGLEPPGSDRRIIIKTTKIMLDNMKIDPVTKKGRSKGFGFLEFQNHSDALACLRYMNACPYVFKADGLPYGLEELQALESGEASESDISALKKARRPIVEFSVENRTILKKKEELVQKQRIAAKEAKANGGALQKIDKKTDKKGQEKKGDKKGANVKKDADTKKQRPDEGPVKTGNKRKRDQDSDVLTVSPKKGKQSDKKKDDKKRDKVETKKTSSQEATQATGKKRKGDTESVAHVKAKNAKQDVEVSESSKSESSKKKKKGETRDSQDDQAFTQLLHKYGKGLFGPESKILK